MLFPEVIKRKDPAPSALGICESTYRFYSKNPLKMRIETFEDLCQYRGIDPVKAFAELTQHLKETA